MQITQVCWSTRSRWGGGHPEGGGLDDHVGSLNFSLEALRSHCRWLSREGTQSNLHFYKMAVCGHCVDKVVTAWVGIS